MKERTRQHLSRKRSAPLAPERAGLAPDWRPVRCARHVRLINKTRGATLAGNERLAMPSADAAAQDPRISDALGLSGRRVARKPIGARIKFALRARK